MDIKSTLKCPECMTRWPWVCEVVILPGKCFDLKKKKRGSFISDPKTRGRVAEGR